MKLNKTTKHAIKNYTNKKQNQQINIKKWDRV
jgi:hypothetical protein